MKQKKLKPTRIEIPISRIVKPTADIKLHRININLVNLEVRRINEYISLSLTDEEVIKLKEALSLYFGY